VFCTVSAQRNRLFLQVAHRNQCNASACIEIATLRS
jgi:hypothetical protein